MDWEKHSKKRIGEILIEEGYLERGHLEEALKIQKKEGGLIGSILVRHGWVTEENLLVALSKQLDLPYIKLANYRVNRSALKLVSREVAERFLFFPFEQDERRVSFAMTDPLNQEALESIKHKTSSRIQVFLATTSEVKEAIGLYYGGGSRLES